MRAELEEYPSCTEAELSSLYFRKLPSVLTVEKVTASHSWYGNDSIKILTGVCTGDGYSSPFNIHFVHADTVFPIWHQLL